MAKPRLLLDENLGGKVADILRMKGYDAKSILEYMRGAKDSAILAQAQKEKRIIVTLDRDFGALVFRDSKEHLGILFLRLQRESSDSICMVLLNVLTQHGDKLQGRFTTASEYRIRIRKR
jgi:predicted nuclease of predicted toxin-antitoxin system